MIEFDEPLSQAGARRSEEILRLAKREARHRRHRRQFARGAVGFVASVAVIGIGLHLFNSRSITSPQPGAASDPNAVAIGWIKTDPSITARLSILPHSRQWQQINDDELLGSLSSAGQQAGLIQMGGQSYLVTPDAPPEPENGG